VFTSSLVLLAATAASAQTANVWVDTNGGSCSRSSSRVPYSDGAACGSLDAANDVAQNGDLVIARGGTYPAQTLSGGGNRTSRATITIAQGEVMLVNGGINFSGARFITVDGGGSLYGSGARLVTTTMGASNAFVPDNQFPANIHGGSHEVTLQGADFGGWAITDSTNTTYRNNDIGPCNSFDGQEGSGAYCDNGSIEYCEVAEIGCRGYNTGHLIEGNYIHDFGCDDSFYNGQGSDDCHWECMYVSYAHNLTVRGNKFSNCANGGNIFHTYSNGGGSFTADFGYVNYTVENNIFEKSCSNNLGGGPWNPCGGRLDAASGIGHCNIYGGIDLTNVLIRFNTFMGGSGFDMTVNCTMGSPGLVFVGNLRNGSSAACASGWTIKPIFRYEVYHTYGSTCAGTGNINIGGSLSSIVLNDTNGASKDARLRGSDGSTQADNRVPTSAGCPSTDFMGTPRPGDSGFCDAGAHERGSGGGGEQPPAPPSGVRIIAAAALSLLSLRKLIA
jgi:hypothetical protein